MPSKQQAQTAAKPVITNVQPDAAIAGGELHIRGRNFATNGRPSVKLGPQAAHLVVAGDSYIIARVPETALVGDLMVASGSIESDLRHPHVGIQIADSLHPVANPAIDGDGNIYTTFSGSRGQKAPVSIYKIDSSYNTRPFLTDLMNPTGLTFDSTGLLYVSSRYDGIVYQITSSGNMSVYVEGMGVATGLAFDTEENLYVGDRSGTVFKIGRNRQIYVFATLEPSIAAYHLAFGPEDELFVTGPTTSSFDAVYRVSRNGEVSVFCKGLGRPQGLAFDLEGYLYVAASLKGRRGIVRIDRNGSPEPFLSGPNVVGLAFSPSRSLIVATQSALFRVDVDIMGRPLS